MRLILLVLASCLALTGCAATQDYHYRLTNHYRAESAWHFSDGPSCYGRFSDYAHGWKRGFYDVSTGSCGDPPVVPPPKYWSTKYQNPDGQVAVEDWYHGYQAGAIEAEQMGMPHWHPVPSTAFAGFEGGGTTLEDVPAHGSPLLHQHSNTVPEQMPSPPVPDRLPDSNSVSP